MDNEAAMKVIRDHFAEDAQVMEVATYALAVIHINEALVRSVALQSTDVGTEIPPESLILVKRYDNGLIKNDFWHENFAAIKSQLVLDDLKLQTLNKYMRFYADKGEKSALKQVKAIMLSRFDVLTVIALFYKGYDFAEEFDAKFRIAVQLPKEHEQFFVNEGA